MNRRRPSEYGRLVLPSGSGLRWRAAWVNVKQKYPARDPGFGGGDVQVGGLEELRVCQWWLLPCLECNEQSSITDGGMIRAIKPEAKASARADGKACHDHSDAQWGNIHVDSSTWVLVGRREDMRYVY